MKSRGILMKNKGYRFFLYPFLVLLLIIAFILRNNTAEIYGAIGDYYYRNNNQQKAQFFYEESLLQNQNNYSIREKYVNSIINSPLTVESQQRLANIVQDGIKDSASMNAEYFLYNLKREIHNKYPHNYILQAPYNQKILHWGKMPITYGFKNQYTVPDEIIKAVNDAFNEWERASSCRIKFSQVKINPDIWVEFIQESPQQIQYGQKYIVAYTTPIINQRMLENMVIKFNILNIEGKMYSPNQIYNTALHEIFHALGLMGHCDEKENIMHMTKDNDSVLNDTRVKLTYADKITLDLLYKIKPDITNAENLEYKYIPYLILGGKEDVNYIKINEAKNYIRKAPSLPNGYIDLADALVSEKKYKEAVENLEKAYRLAKSKDTRYIVFYNLAVAYYYQDAYILALDYLNNAKEIRDENELHILAAEIYLKQKQEEKAIEEYRYLIAQEPENIDYAINLANVYVRKKKHIQARNVLREFLNKNPKERTNPKLSPYKKLFL